MLSSLSKPWTEAWLSFSEWALLLFGVLLVIGLIGEYLAEHKKVLKLQKRKWVYEMFVIFGVAGELFADGGVFLFSSHLQTIANLEVAKLNDDAKQASRDAEFAKKETEEFRSENLVLKKSVYEIAGKIQETRTNLAKIEDFLSESNILAQLDETKRNLDFANKVSADVRHLADKQTAPRGFTVEKRRELSWMLGDSGKGIRVKFNINPNVPDAKQLAEVLAKALKMSGFIIDPKYDMNIVSYGKGPERGVFIGMSGSTNTIVDSLVTDLEILGIRSTKIDTMGSPEVLYIDILYP